MNVDWKKNIIIAIIGLVCNYVVALQEVSPMIVLLDGSEMTVGTEGVWPAKPHLISPGIGISHQLHPASGRELPRSSPQVCMINFRKCVPSSSCSSSVVIINPNWPLEAVHSFLP